MINMFLYTWRKLQLEYKLVGFLNFTQVPWASVKNVEYSFVKLNNLIFQNQYDSYHQRITCNVMKSPWCRLNAVISSINSDDTAEGKNKTLGPTRWVCAIKMGDLNSTPKNHMEEEKTSFYRLSSDCCMKHGTLHSE